MPAPADSPNRVTPVGIPTERRDVVTHPVQGSERVAQADVGVETPAGSVERRQVEEAEHAESVIERHDDGVAAGTASRRPLYSGWLADPRM